MRRSSGVTLTASEKSCTEQLARFFPSAAPVRVPVQVTALRGGSTRFREATVIEFGGTEHAIFLSTLPLEFADRVRVEGNRKGCTFEGTVIAVQYHEGCKAVAVQVLRGPSLWMRES